MPMLVLGRICVHHVELEPGGGRRSYYTRCRLCTREVVSFPRSSQLIGRFFDDYNED